MCGLLGSAISNNQDFPWLAWWRKATLTTLDAVCVIWGKLWSGTQPKGQKPQNCCSYESMDVFRCPQPCLVLSSAPLHLVSE